MTFLSEIVFITDLVDKELKSMSFLFIFCLIPSHTEHLAASVS